jgi:hypothetical protein
VHLHWLFTFNVEKNSQIESIKFCQQPHPLYLCRPLLESGYDLGGEADMFFVDFGV